MEKKKYKGSPMFCVDHVLTTYKPEEMISDYKACDLLVKTLLEAEAEASVIFKILEFLEGCIHLMNQDHKRLVKAVLNIDWLDKGPELIKAYHAFVLNLMSAHTDYFKPFLVVMVKKLRQDYVVSGEQSEEEKLKSQQKTEQGFQHIHILLQSLCRLIPITTVILLPLLEEFFPYINKGVSVFENYTRNLLKITSYIPGLRKEILDLIVKNMLKLDVRVSRETLSNANQDEEEALSEDDEDDDEEEDNGIFDMEISSAKEEDKVKVKVKDKAKEDRLADLVPQAVTLDALMILVLNYSKDTCYPGGNLDWTETKKFYRELLSTFDRFIFPTYLSNHTQFILFQICSFREPLADGFIDYLWKKVTDPMSQPIYRQIAACYIGSFLARANFVPVSTAQTMMKLMVQWVHQYLDQTCDSNTQADIAHHAAFYSVCQSCFYIFCFRHTQFIQMKKGYKWAEALNFQRIITSKLNPLKFCLPIIVKTFSSATRNHQLAFCDTIIERNNRYNLPVCSANLMNGQTEKQLHSFFPFDPYLLKRSGSLINPIYKEYQGFLPDEDVLEDEDEDDFLPQDDVVKSQQLLGTSVDKNTVDLLQYGVSPGFQHGFDMT